MDDLGGVGVAGEVCACDAMEEVHENVTGLPVVLILGRVGRIFLCFLGSPSSAAPEKKIACFRLYGHRSLQVGSFGSNFF